VQTTERDRRSTAPGGRGRRLPVGAEVMPGGGVAFRVWAPARQRVEVVIEGAPEALALERGDDGYWSGSAPKVRSGARYRYRLDGDGPFPDPASRFQPDGPHGPSEVVDPMAYAWSDGAWNGARLEGQVVYELHLGTFSPEGTWNGARGRLEFLRDVGVTMIELMPVAAFPGSFGWGYDGVNLYAPHAGYGRPDDFRAFVDEAHRLGLAVALDVVYNHLGPDGNYLAAFAPGYFSSKRTEWGEAINFDGADAAPVRELFAGNAAYWIDEYHLDGLRLDATQSIFDESPEHIVAELGRRARAAAAAQGRSIVISAENEPQNTDLVRPLEQGGYGLDCLWNDDLHHSLSVALTGRREGYYTDYNGSPQELISAVKYGFLFQGQWYGWQKQRRGTVTRGLRPAQFVAYLENHDQVANSATGERMWQLSSPGRHRALTALLLLGPWTPLLLQGQEWNASAPFLFFAEHDARLSALVRKGRAEFLAQFARVGSPEIRERLADPGARETAVACRLDWSEAAHGRHAQALDLHRDLLTLRRADRIIAAQGEGGVQIDGAVLGPEALALRYFGPGGDDRLLVVNLARDLPLVPASEPLLAPPRGQRWTLAWSSESGRYGGSGTPPLDKDGGWWVPGHTAVLLAPERAPERDHLGEGKEPPP
jgi:maltooligosyltrehalose trehalohydrolase